LDLRCKKNIYFSKTRRTFSVFFA